MWCSPPEKGGCISEMRLTLSGGQVGSKATQSLSSTGQRTENVTKGLWVDIKTRKDHSSVTVTDKKDSAWGN